MDLGISRAIDHAVYTLLNALAIILWRIDAAIMGMATLSYQTQDWLTGEDGGIWRLLARLVGADGLFGLSTWQVFLTLALVLFGFGRVVRPFWRTQPVDLGRLFFFAVLAHLAISQGSTMMRQAELWRTEAGSYMYQAVAADGGLDLEIPGGVVDRTDPIPDPLDLDGQAPIRGWEAVGSSYFMATNLDQLYAATPPPDFLMAYCLYDPVIPINDQADENSAGCSPRKAWDEWDQITVTGPITSVFGIPLPVDVSLELPLYQEHPENRQLGIRQAQAGVARLALGPIVALFPMIEANVGLMLALAASFIYLSLPITLLFGFFLYTEAMATRLFLQFISVFIRTLIMQGLVALFLMLLIGVSVGGSLTIYLGLIGVGLVGGFFLTRLAAGTMKETLAQSLGAVGGIWLGASTGVLGQSAAAPARTALGMAKLGATGAALVTAGHSGGLWRMMDLGETAYQSGQSGRADLRSAAPQNRRSTLPAPLVKLATEPAAKPSMSARLDEPVKLRPAVPLPSQLVGAAQARPDSPALTSSNDQAVEQWTAQVYRTRHQGRGQRQVAETGQRLLGEQLSRETQSVLARHDEAHVRAVLQSTRRARVELPPESFMRPDGQLSPEAIDTIRIDLPPEAAQAFAGKQGQRDLTTLVAAGTQLRQEVQPEAFQQAVAQARPGRGQQAPGRTIPHALGLDPAAAGRHFANLNRFVRLSEAAGLSPVQRQRLLREVKEAGTLSAQLRRELEAALRQKRQTGLKVADLVGSAQSLPATLQGPQQVKLPGGQVQTHNQKQLTKAQSKQDRRRRRLETGPDVEP